MKLLLPFLILIALVLANPVPEGLLDNLPILQPRADECEACATNYTLCYNLCFYQQILNQAVCAASCGAAKGCKVVCHPIMLHADETVV
jgi:hypothetical protein